MRTPSNRLRYTPETHLHTPSYASTYAYVCSMCPSKDRHASERVSLQSDADEHRKHFYVCKRTELPSREGKQPASSSALVHGTEDYLQVKEIYKKRLKLKSCQVP